METESFKAVRQAMMMDYAGLGAEQWELLHHILAPGYAGKARQGFLARDSDDMPEIRE